MLDHEDNNLVYHRGSAAKRKRSGPVLTKIFVEASKELKEEKWPAENRTGGYAAPENSLIPHRCYFGRVGGEGGEREAVIVCAVFKRVRGAAWVS